MQGWQLDRRRRLPVALAMLDDDSRKDAAAYVPASGQSKKARADGGDQIVEYPVGHRFVKRAFIPERPHVLLQRFQLDVAAIGHAVNDQQRKIGLARQRTQTGELGDLEVDQVIPARVWVWKNIYNF